MEEGHTVVVVEHTDVMKAADCIIDLGPEGGAGGGTLVAWGPPEKIAATKKSHTGRFLKALLKDVPRPQGDDGKSLLALVENSETHIEIEAANEHNLKSVNVRIPRDKFVVTGPSGSGKSTLALISSTPKGRGVISNLSRLSPASLLETSAGPTCKVSLDFPNHCD